jgi:hypothetical protein
MSSFKDTEGRIWTLRLTVASIRRIKDIAGVDLSVSAFFSEGSLLAELSSDYLKVARVVYAAVAPEAEKRGISEEAFQDALSGDCIEQMSNAFLEALADFFPGLQGNVLRRVLKASEEQKEKLARQAEEEIEKALETFSPSAMNSLE